VTVTDVIVAAGTLRMLIWVPGEASGVPGSGEIVGAGVATGRRRSGGSETCGEQRRGEGRAKPGQDGRDGARTPPSRRSMRGTARLAGRRSAVAAVHAFLLLGVVASSHRYG
jgi:hypothetical protein